MSLMNGRILLKVLPLSFSFGVIKTGLHFAGFEPWVFDSLTGSLLGAGTFALTLVLSGTLSDYRASEGMPMQIVNALETMQDSNVMVAKSDPNHDATILQKHIVAVSQAILGWLKEDKLFTAVEMSLDELNAGLATLRSLEGGLLVVHRIQIELARVRSLVQQIKANRDSDFVPAAYTLLLLFLAASTIALLLIKTESFSENLIIPMFLFTSLLYLFIFIRDLDNPFDYDGKSAVDVDLSCLEQLHDRLK